MRGNEWKLALAFIVGAVLSFLAGMYVLGPLFVPQKPDESAQVSEAEGTSTIPSLTESIPNGIYRSDVDSVPDHTAVIVERVPRPYEGETEQTFPQPSTQFEVPERSTPQQPSIQAQPPTSSTPEEPEVSEPISPPKDRIQPPPPPVSKSTPPPAAKAKRNYRVRVGVFTQEQNVKSMVESLSALGYSPYVEEEVVGDQRRYRVYVGAFENKESAERLKAELSEKGYPTQIEEKQE